MINAIVAEDIAVVFDVVQCSSHGAHLYARSTGTGVEYLLHPDMLRGGPPEGQAVEVGALVSIESPDDESNGKRYTFRKIQERAVIPPALSKRRQNAPSVRTVQ
jgi:hypothetical protein